MLNKEMFTMKIEELAAKNGHEAVRTRNNAHGGYDGLAVHGITSECVVPCFNVDQAYQVYCSEGVSPETLYEEFKKSVAKTVPGKKEIRKYSNTLGDYELAKAHIIPVLVSSRYDNPDSVSLEYLDLQVIFRIFLNNTSSAVVTKTLAESWGKTAEDLLEDSKKNLPQQMVFKSMFSFMEDMVGFGMEAPKGPAVYVLTNENSYCGAGQILSDQVLEDVKEKVKGDFFILPSSIHETLILPDDGERDPASLQMMVREVNSSAVSAEDFLSDNIYRYHSDLDTISVLSIVAA